MNKNMMIYLALGVVGYLLWEQSQKSATTTGTGTNTQIPCAPGFTNINGQCVQNPSTQFPCATGFTNVNNQCVQNPNSGSSSDPLGDLLNQLTNELI